MSLPAFLPALFPALGALPMLPALKVVLLAGGGKPEQNYNSHAVHVQTMAALLAERGVPASDVTIFWADGTDDGPDRSVRAADDQMAGDWILEDTHLDAGTHAPLTLVDTRFPGYTVEPARREALRRYFKRTASKLAAGDTLFIAVTDHGEPDPKDARDTRITLWGERWTRSEMTADLAPVHGSVRVVLSMSQCFSGGFAEIALARPNTCGAFAANASQVAYGCFPDLAGRLDVGHFVHMRDGLAATGSLAGASDWAMLRDDTPDQPHLSSDMFLTDYISDEAERRGLSGDALVDEALSRIPDDAPERRQALRVAQAYGLGSVPDQVTMGRRFEEVEDLQYLAARWRDLWAPALTSGRRFLAAAFTVNVRKGAPQAEKRLVRAAFVDRLAAAARAQPGLEDLLLALLNRHAQAGAALERLDTQAAAVLRVGDLFARAAAPRLLPAEEKAKYDALRLCERALLLPGATGAAPVAPSAFPSLPAMRALVDSIRPGYFGVRYEDEGEDDPAAAPARRKGVPVGRGPVIVRDVSAGSPADKAGLRAGDVVRSVDGEPLTRPGRFRETAFFSTPGQARRLGLRRGDQDLEVTLIAEPFPAGRRPVGPGEPVGILPLTTLGPADAKLPEIGTGQEVVLLFWATWCKPCKASLPALGKWASERGASVIAVTDESAEVVRKFLTGYGAFPFAIALDPGGTTRALFDAQATPTFIRIDARGRYSESGIGFDGRIPLRD